MPDGFFLEQFLHVFECGCLSSHVPRDSHYLEMLDVAHSALKLVQLQNTLRYLFLGALRVILRSLIEQIGILAVLIGAIASKAIRQEDAFLVVGLAPAHDRRSHSTVQARVLVHRVQQALHIASGAQRVNLNYAVVEMILYLLFTGVGAILIYVEIGLILESTDLLGEASLVLLNFFFLLRQVDRVVQILALLERLRVAELTLFDFFQLSYQARFVNAVARNILIHVLTAGTVRSL